MARQFDIPSYYKSEITSRIKQGRRLIDPKKKDLSPSILDFGGVRFIFARHFGFCYGVENAIEIVYKTLEENPDKRIFLLSEMIHNPNVNTDLQSRGIQFIHTTLGEQLIPWDELTRDDLVVVPAFGTTVEIKEMLTRRGIDFCTYDTTCPFVEKVWTRGGQIGQQGFTVVIHGKPRHEETRATFSHSVQQAPTVVVRNREETLILADIITGKVDRERFFDVFGENCSEGFDPEIHLDRVGVINQTTMLASETHEIARLIREALEERYGTERIADHFADTSDTLCYASNENQNATYAMIEKGADVALVVGGYNSSNTSHLVELCEETISTFFINSSKDILSDRQIRHFDLESKSIVATIDWLPATRPVDIILTCGASCPDIMLDNVLLRILSFFPDTPPVAEVLAEYEHTVRQPVVSAS
ncbi:MAG: 4-hydroxy-3-methylbut-2-enyl diphosphate reductase [Gemmatimonadetes bacterium]|nr:4-hydroxy-3-methylbut-2-enyl diphosphate reductase [Gemmatimonadota bacterium]